MALQLLAVTFDAHDPARLARFWGELLGRRVIDDTRGALLLGSQTQLGLRFSPDAADDTGPGWAHLHLTSASLADQEEVVRRALALGSHHLDVGQRREEGHVVLGDPEGNPFCVIEPDNDYLAGTGFLGELAAEGSRDVGLFWSQALGWPLVWDQDDETVVQSPHGGTKVAWGGARDFTKVGTNRQRLEAVPVEASQGTEVERLVGLGATRLQDERDGAVMLADPDGNEFSVLTA